MKTIWRVNEMSGKIDSFDYEEQSIQFYIGKNGRLLDVLSELYERHFDDHREAIKFAHELTKTLIANYTKNIKNLEAQKMHIENLAQMSNVKCV